MFFTGEKYVTAKTFFLTCFYTTADKLPGQHDHKQQLTQRTRQEARIIFKKLEKVPA